MSDLDGLINLIPIGDIAKKLGIDESVARAAGAVAVPAIVGGLAANAKDQGGAASLESALGNHAGKTVKTLDDVDEKDGQKIVKNVFGSKTDEVAAAAGAKAGGPDSGAIVAQVLPIVAPIVLAWVAQQFLGGKKAAPEAAAPAPAAPASTGTDIGSLLGGLLSSKEGQDVVGGLLGGLLGGGKK